MENILLNLTVKKVDGYHGDWKAAIDEAYILSKRFNIGCLLTYAQYSFRILPTMTTEEIDRIKTKRIIIGL